MGLQSVLRVFGHNADIADIARVLNVSTGELQHIAAHIDDDAIAQIRTGSGEAWLEARRNSEDLANMPEEARNALNSSAMRTAVQTLQQNIGYFDAVTEFVNEIPAKMRAAQDSGQDFDIIQELEEFNTTHNVTNGPLADYARSRILESINTGAQTRAPFRSMADAQPRPSFAEQVNAAREGIRTRVGADGTIEVEPVAPSAARAADPARADAPQPEAPQPEAPRAETSGPSTDNTARTADDAADDPAQPNTTNNADNAADDASGSSRNANEASSSADNAARNTNRSNQQGLLRGLFNQNAWDVRPGPLRFLYHRAMRYDKIIKIVDNMTEHSSSALRRLFAEDNGSYSQLAELKNRFSSFNSLSGVQQSRLLDELNSTNSTLDANIRYLDQKIEHIERQIDNQETRSSLLAPLSLGRLRKVNENYTGGNVFRLDDIQISGLRQYVENLRTLSNDLKTELNTSREFVDGRASELNLSDDLITRGQHTFNESIAHTAEGPGGELSQRHRLHRMIMYGHYYANDHTEFGRLLVNGKDFNAEAEIYNKMINVDPSSLTTPANWTNEISTSIANLIKNGQAHEAFHAVDTWVRLNFMKLQENGSYQHTRVMSDMFKSTMREIDGIRGNPIHEQMVSDLYDYAKRIEAGGGGDTGMRIRDHIAMRDSLSMVRARHFRGAPLSGIKNGMLWGTREPILSFEGFKVYIKEPLLNRIIWNQLGKHNYGGQIFNMRIRPDLDRFKLWTTSNAEDGKKSTSLQLGNLRNYIDPTPATLGVTGVIGFNAIADFADDGDFEENNDIFGFETKVPGIAYANPFGPTYSIFRAGYNTLHGNPFRNWERMNEDDVSADIQNIRQSINERIGNNGTQINSISEDSSSVLFNTYFRELDRDGRRSLINRWSNRPEEFREAVREANGISALQSAWTANIAPFLSGGADSIALSVQDWQTVYRENFGNPDTTSARAVSTFTDDNIDAITNLTGAVIALETTTQAQDQQIAEARAAAIADAQAREQDRIEAEQRRAQLTTRVHDTLAVRAQSLNVDNPALIDALTAAIMSADNVTVNRLLGDEERLDDVITQAQENTQHMDPSAAALESINPVLAEMMPAQPPAGVASPGNGGGNGNGGGLGGMFNGNSGTPVDLNDGYLINAVVTELGDFGQNLNIGDLDMTAGARDILARNNDVRRSYGNYSEAQTALEADPANPDLIAARDTALQAYQGNLRSNAVHAVNAVQTTAIAQHLIANNPDLASDQAHVYMAAAIIVAENAVDSNLEALINNDQQLNARFDEIMRGIDDGTIRPNGESAQILQTLNQDGRGWLQRTLGLSDADLGDFLVWMSNGNDDTLLVTSSLLNTGGGILGDAWRGARDGYMHMFNEHRTATSAITALVGAVLGMNWLTADNKFSWFGGLVGNTLKIAGIAVGGALLFRWLSQGDGENAPETVASARDVVGNQDQNRDAALESNTQEQIDQAASNDNDQLAGQTQRTGHDGNLAVQQVDGNVIHIGGAGGDVTTNGQSAPNGFAPANIGGNGSPQNPGPENNAANDRDDLRNEPAPNLAG